uniref:Endo-beta-1,2-glucanase SGL domain-containing protein n=1 Tax=Fusarium oxysporum (strain Fo5176) TaxID=660025 RepID=A0A0D2YAC5_FUSOF
MKSSLSSVLAALALSLPLAAASPQYSNPQAPSCRFGLEWSQKDVLQHTDDFIWDLLYWEGKFHQNDVAYNTQNGMSYDGTQLDWKTGKRTKKHTFSAASKEALQIMLYAQAISGSKEAARFLTPDNLKAAPGFAASIMETKLKTYSQFNQTYPGFGGFLPWIKTDTTTISPQDGWDDRVPGLDNGELIWAVYASIEALQKQSNPKFHKIADGWQAWLNYVASTAPKIFYIGKGKVCAVTAIGDQTLPVNDKKQSYKCESETYLDDPYEGELLTYFFQFFTDLSTKDKQTLWEYKRAKLEKAEYNKGGVGPITVRKGFCRLFKNGERARTCNSVVTKTPGLYASVNNSTDPKTDEIIGYISPAGIPSIASQKDQELDVITPYGVFPVVLFDKAVGLAWWRNMIVGKKMQNPYGSTESTRVDGKGVSALVTWDSKVTTVLSLMNGVVDLREHVRVFGNKLKGEDIEFCLPKNKVPDAGLKDFTTCQK